MTIDSYGRNRPEGEVECHSGLVGIYSFLIATRWTEPASHPGPVALRLGEAEHDTCADSIASAAFGPTYGIGDYNVGMSAERPPTDKAVAALLTRYRCSTPFHAVRARFMGAIASPLEDRSPVHAIQELWQGNLPPFDSIEDFNHLLDVLVAGVWNRLTAHQVESNPFRLTRLPARLTPDGLLHYAQVRQQEVEGFIDGLFGPHEEIDLPESARGGIDILGEIRAMFAGAMELLGRTGLPTTPGGLSGLHDNFRSLTAILEREMNTVVLSCTRARRQGLAKLRQPKRAVQQP